MGAIKFQNKKGGTFRIGAQIPGFFLSLSVYANSKRNSGKKNTVMFPFYFYTNRKGIDGSLKNQLQADTNKQANQ